MSGNINDTNTVCIKTQITDFINDIENGVQCDYKERYNELYTTSVTLFKMIDVDIRKEMQSGTFSKHAFESRINKFLSLIKGIQDGRISQYNASSVVGKDVADEYAPVLTQLKK